MDEISERDLAALADLYDRFAHAIDPFSEVRDLAENQFYGMLNQLRCRCAPEMDERAFNRGVIVRCKRHLAKN